MIYLLIGKAASGKDTFKNILLEGNHFHNAISFTTRPMRINEQQNVDYHFISDDEMKKIVSSGQALETTEYLQKDGSIFKYCYTRDCFSKDKDNLMIINPIGLKQISRYDDIKNQLRVIYLVQNDEVRKQRYFDREGYSKELETKWNTRYLRDEEDFKDLIDFLDNEKIPVQVIEGTVENAIVLKEELVK